MSNFSKDIESIIEAVGGKENIKTVTHCITRLRLILKNSDSVSIKDLDNNELVKGHFFTGGQFQIIIGPGLVDRAYQELIRQTGIQQASQEEVSEILHERKNLFQRFIRILADIFIPILPAIVASGLLMGLNNLLANPGIFYEESFLSRHSSISGLVGLINMIATTSYAFLPALVGWSAVKKFGGNPILGIVIGLVLVHPSLMSAYDYAADPSLVNSWSLFGWEAPQVGYQGQVIPVIIVSFLLAKLEIFLQKFIPDSLQLVLIAPIALLGTGFLTFYIIGPITMAGANYITSSVVYLFEVSPILAGAFWGFICSPLVITGMHHLFLGVNLQMAGSLGYVTFWPIGETATMAQGAACLAMFYLFRKQKNKKLSSVSLAATMAAYTGGITEPAIYGINLRFRYPFLAVMIASSIGSAYLSYQGVKASNVGVGGLLSILSVFPEYWLSYFIGQSLTIILTITLTILFYKFNILGAKASTYSSSD